MGQPPGQLKRLGLEIMMLLDGTDIQIKHWVEQELAARVLLALFPRLREAQP